MSQPTEDGVGQGVPEAGGGTAGAERRSRRIIIAGSLFTALLVTVLLTVGNVRLVHVLGLGALLGLLPTVSLAQLPMIRTMDLPRMEVYQSSAVTLFILAGLSVVLATRVGGPGLGFVLLPPAVFLGWTLTLLAAGLAVTLAARRVAMAMGIREDPILRTLIPETSEERRAFAGLSVGAGFGEELAYRAYVIPMLVPLVGTAGAVVLSSAVFGVLHVYQGALGIARTTIIGLVMAWGFLASGSLWPPVVAHLVFDLLAGIFFAEQLMVPTDEGGVSGADVR